ncbi:NAD-dependent deacylase [Zavarzinia compransoris]|uniref:NAD-dependent deacylase n=1 Tax=Zavarzinia marina TaxID=2911065 RepID=UPI001F417A0D|nr:NAD-dependent deacylase [Zavarzinia marina]MCF4165362.1 NAD-dependent deacylase [Zavarzinia marina]
MGYGHIVILTGAGISAESGLGTFRDKDGLWTRYNLEDVATPEGFARNPVFVHEFYNARRANLRDARPNAAHEALARLETAWPGDVLIVTQNVDDLHEQAGSRNVIHMHGELSRIRCGACETVSEHRHDLFVDSECADCGVAGTLRPHVVWFGEMPLRMEEIFTALDECDLFVSIGTSGTVYPAAGFVAHVRRFGHARTVELNLDPSEGHSLFAETRYGPASELVPAFVDELLKA